MNEILAAVIPLFAVVAVGAAAGRWHPAFDTVGAAKLNALVFYFAVPALAFRTIVGSAESGSVEPRLLLAYVGGETLAFAFAALAGWFVWRRSLAGCVVMGLGGCFSNGFYMALPLTFALLGDVGAAQLLLILAFDTMILLPAAMVLLDLAKAQDIASGRREGTVRGASTVLRAAFANVVRNPVVAATVVALAVGFSGLGTHPWIDQTLAMIGQAALPCALFAIGCDLAHRGVERAPGAIGSVVIAKLALHPLAVFGLGLYLELPALPLTVATLAASMPVGTTVFIAASQYRAAIGIASTSILVSTSLALVTISAVLFALSEHGLLP